MSDYSFIVKLISNDGPYKFQINVAYYKGHNIVVTGYTSVENNRQSWSAIRNWMPFLVTDRLKSNPQVGRRR